ncbi:acyltransferase family protein [Maribellus sediminis]|uniref:acyltransferase family protein n=1 Tax=Maribellus sediminis TaxID=2696285 RepID=UPI00143221A2|nr:acyltransferase [Maribellus sediminis]
MLGIKIDYEKRIYGFDLLRAFAIFCVIHGHGKHLLTGTMLEGFPWVPLPRGVDIFFVLSGFLIGYSFISGAAKTNGQLKFGKAMNFWERSALRILPNYYLLLAVNYFLVKSEILNGSVAKFSPWLFATFTQNLWYPFYDFFWESWSLATQEWFYLLFPLLLLFFTRNNRLKQSIVIISGFFITIAIIYRINISGTVYDTFWWDVNFRKVALSRIDSIFFGVLAAWVRFFYAESWKKFALPAFISGIVIFLIMSSIPKNTESIYYNIIYLSLSPIFIALLFPLIDRLKDSRSVVGRFITVISFLSYSMYLLNLLFIQLIDKHYPNLLANHATFKYLLFLLVTFTGSYLLYQLYEHPIATLGNKILHTSKMMYKRMDNGRSSGKTPEK